MKELREDQMGEEEEEKDGGGMNGAMLKYTPNLQNLPDKLLGQMLHILQSFPNETIDMRQPHIRKSLEEFYPTFLILYGLIMVIGALGNVGMVMHILRRRLYRETTCAYLLNIALCNVVMVLVVLPMSLAILLIQNWVFGSFLCYFVPMIQVSGWCWCCCCWWWWW